MQSGALMIGAPAYWSLMEATVRLGHWLGVPVRAGGSLTDAHLPDAQAGIESALAIDTVLRTGAQYVLHAAGILSSFNCFSPDKFVIDDEVQHRSARRAAADRGRSRRPWPSTSSRPPAPAAPCSATRTRASTRAWASGGRS